MATCTCDCCNPDTPTTLNYTTKEINQILADGVINASVRYAPVGQNYLQLTLADALALVPDKERTTVRILTFLNKDTQPKPEVWIYFGTDILTWSDATKWVIFQLIQVVLKINNYANWKQFCYHSMG